LGMTSKVCNICHSLLGICKQIIHQKCPKDKLKLERQVCNPFSTFKDEGY